MVSKSVSAREALIAELLQVLENIALAIEVEGDEVNVDNIHDDARHAIDRANETKAR